MFGDWPVGNFIKSKNGSNKILNLLWKNRVQWHKLGTIWLESNSQGKKTQGCSGQVEHKLVVLPDSRKKQQWMLLIA